MLEARVSVDTVQRLGAKGHKVELVHKHSTRMGRGAAVMHDSKTKVNFGAADPRADGSAEPEPPRP
jgi:gamma-glutamyltranspeptidase/glutathione hydrolase